MTKTMAKLILVVAAVALLAVWCAVPAMADDIHFACSTCTTGSVTQLSTSTTVGFDFVSMQSFSGDAFIAILVPNGLNFPGVSLTGGGPGSITLQGPFAGFNSGDLDTFLVPNESFSAYNFSQLSSATAQVGITATTFTVYEFDLGERTLDSTGVSGLSVTAPIGSVVIGWLECDSNVKCNGQDGGTLQVPLSSDITIPEPGTIGMLGLGLVTMLGMSMLRRRPEVGSL
jgi:hypothetical protein